MITTKCVVGGSQISLKVVECPDDPQWVSYALACSHANLTQFVTGCYLDKITKLLFVGLT